MDSKFYNVVGILLVRYRQIVFHKKLFQLKRKRNVISKASNYREKKSAIASDKVIQPFIDECV